MSTTPNRAYRYPASSDAVTIADYFSNLANDVDTDVAAIFTDYFTPVTDTDPGTVSAGFTEDGNQIAVTLLDGHLVHIVLFLTLTAVLTATTGNIADTTCYTLDAAYWPDNAVNAVVGNGSMTGEATIGSSGVVQVRAASDTIANGSNIRITATYIKS